MNEIHSGGRVARPQRVRSFSAAWLTAMVLANGGYCHDFDGPNNVSQPAINGQAAEHATSSEVSAIGAGNTMAATNSSFLIFPLQADLKIMGSGPGTMARPINHTTVVSHDFTLKAAESRRVQGRLELTVSWNQPAEVDDDIECWFLDPVAGWQPYGDKVGAGTNHQGSAAGWLVLSSSRLLQAASAGTYRCAVTTYTSDTSMDHYETVASIGVRKVAG